ncbi:MAG TPA: YhcH/YjgK/YiaL family protein [Vicinamibacterales bacterium]|nr:YhcH/YjgK/YiaL family protein [Vicinamibacterales bacterium]
MIIDRLTDRALDAGLPADLRRVLTYLRTTDLAGLPVGRHPIEGDRIFALVQDYTTRPPDECVWEAHRRHIDVQYVVRGVERIGWVPLAHAVERRAYDPERDVALFDPGRDYVTVRAGMFAIFTPHDVHSPSVAAGEPAPVRKVVVKVVATKT